MITAHLRPAVFLAGSLGCCQTLATTPADQELIRQQERSKLLRQQQAPPTDIHLEPPQAANSSALLPLNAPPCFIIRHLQLTGTHAEQFQWLLAAANKPDDIATGRCLGEQGINLLMNRMQNALIARGFVTSRVLTTVQDLNQGTLVLTLVAGHVKDLRLTPDSDPRATRWNAVAARPGDLLNLRGIEQTLENFMRVPTVNAEIQITPSESADARPGDSDLLISWKQGFPLRLQLSADDAGSKSTGRHQGTATLSYNNWLGLHDLLYLSLNHDLDGKSRQTRRMQGYTLHYQIPYGYWLLSLSSSQYDYRQSVAGAYQTYLYSGSSDKQAIQLAHLLYRDAARKTGIYLRAWAHSSRNHIDDTEVQVQRRRMAGWELGLTHRAFIGQATLDASLAWRRGTGAMNALPAPEEPFGEGTSRPALTTADLQLMLPLGKHWRYHANWRAQWNSTPLVPQDRFAIAGRHTVRGFDGENILLAERGWLIRNDLALSLKESGQQLYIGLDYGEVDGPSADYLAGKRLAGAVVGLRGRFKGFSYDVFIGQPYRKPHYFQTANTTAGFTVSWSP